MESALIRPHAPQNKAILALQRIDSPLSPLQPSAPAPGDVTMPREKIRKDIPFPQYVTRGFFLSPPPVFSCGKDQDITWVYLFVRNTNHMLVDLASDCEPQKEPTELLYKANAETNRRRYFVWNNIHIDIAGDYYLQFTAYKMSYDDPQYPNGNLVVVKTINSPTIHVVDYRTNHLPEFTREEHELLQKVARDSQFQVQNVLLDEEKDSSSSKSRRKRK